MDSTALDAPASQPAEPQAVNYGWKPAIFGFIIWALMSVIFRTLRMRYENFERIAEVAGGGKGLIVATWHGRSIIAAAALRNRGYWAMISLSRDGEMQNQILGRFGFRSIRGSTGRGGARATIQLCKKLQEGGVLAFTPDGPRGPTHKVQMGAVFFAKRTGCPIIAMGLSARPRKLLRNWDSYMIPMPFARGAFVVGEPIYVAADLDEAGQQRAAEELEREINRVEKRAEEMLGLTYPAEYLV